MGLQLNVACEREGGTNILGGHKVAVAEVNVPVLCEEKKTHSARGPNSEPCVCVGAYCLTPSPPPRR